MRKSIVLGLRLVAAVLLFAAAVLGGTSLWRWYSALPQQIAGSVFAGAIALITFLLTKSWERHRDLEREQRANRIPTYQKILTAMFSYVDNAKSDQTKADEEIKRVFNELNPQLIVWGSDDVIRAYVNWRSSIGTGSGVQDMLRLAELLLTIRKDVGHQNKNIGTFMILSVFVNDLQAAVADEVKALKARA